LDDLEFHVVLVPVTIGPADDVAGLEIAGLDITQRDLLVAESEDPVEMTLDHFHEVPVRFEATPLELVLPILPEPQSAALVGVIPQLAEGFLKQVGLGKLRAGSQDGVQGFSRLTPNPGTARQQYELLAREGLLEAAQSPAQLGLADRVERVVEVADHMELVEDDLEILAAVGAEAVLEGPAHVHDGMRDLGRTLLTEPTPELFEPLLGASLDDIEHLWTAGAFQGTQERPAFMSLADPDLINTHHGDSVHLPLGLDLRQSPLIDLLDRVPMQAEKDGHGFDRRDLADLVDERRQRAGDPGTSDIGELQSLGAHAAVGADHPIARETQDGLMLPEGQVSQLLDGVILGSRHELSAVPADITLACTFKVNPNHAAPRQASDLIHGNHAIPLNLKQPCETIKIICLHLVRPPVLSQQKATASGALFSTTLFTHSSVP